MVWRLHTNCPPPENNSLYPRGAGCSGEQLKPAPVLADLTHSAHSAHRPLVLCVILGSVKSALLEAGAAVDWCVAGGADFKLGELVKLNLDRVMGVALALRLCLLGTIQDLARTAVSQYPVGKAEGRVVVFASHGEVHGIE